MIFINILYIRLFYFVGFFANMVTIWSHRYNLSPPTVVRGVSVQIHKLTDLAPKCSGNFQD